MKVKTLQGVFYVVTGSAGCTVTAERNGETKTLLMLEVDGQGTFAAISDEVDVSDDKALLHPFASAPASALGGGVSGGGSGASVEEEQLIHASVGLDSLAAGPGAVAYCADSLAVGLGAVVGATYASNSKDATATRKSTTAESETNNTSKDYSSNSAAVGLHAQASGSRSTAYGNFAKASGPESTASGYCSSASVSQATAIGAYSTASGPESTASGYGSSASVSQATAIGAYSTASGSNSTAIGELSSATGHYGASLGYNSKAVGQSSSAIGDSTKATGNYSIASGSKSNASSHGSIAIGFQASSSSAYSTAIGARSSVSSRCPSSVAIGAGAYVNDNGVLALNAGGGSISYGGVGYSTQLYIITKGSKLSTDYLGGEAGLGYLVIDHVAGSIVARGVIPLGIICTDHASDFTPTGYDKIGNY